MKAIPLMVARHFAADHPYSFRCESSACRGKSKAVRSIFFLNRETGPVGKLILVCAPCYDLNRRLWLNMGHPLVEHIPLCVQQTK